MKKPFLIYQGRFFIPIKHQILKSKNHEKRGEKGNQNIKSAEKGKERKESVDNENSMW